MSASKYAHTINEQRYKLLEQLVTKLLHVEVSHGDWHFGCLTCPPHQQQSSRCLLFVLMSAAVQQGDENFELARDFCVQKAWFNIFPAVNPRETEAFYAECVA